MKKLLFIIVCMHLSTTFLFAQNLKIYRNGNLLTNNQIIDTNCGLTELVNLPLHVKNISSATINVKLKKIENSLVAGSENAFCYAGQCYSPATMVSLNYSEIPANTIDTTFVADYNANGGSGTSNIRYVFFNTANPSDTVSVIVRYNSAVGINNISASDVFFSDIYPNPSSNTANINYSLPKNTTSARISIRNILGASITDLELNDLSGKKTINTNELNDGIYFYSLIVNEKVFYTRKLVVKH
jgi:hypothetical protein